MEALCASVSPEIGATLANKPTAKLAWEAIEARRVGSDRVRRAALQCLRGEWEGLTFRPDEQIEDFVVRLTNLMEQMVRNGDTDLDEARAVEKFLRCMPKRYEQLRHLCFAKELNQVRKLDDRSRPRVFIGYADGAKAYRVYDLMSRCVLVSRDVVFDET